MGECKNLELGNKGVPAKNPEIANLPLIALNFYICGYG
jgi:hypothetical protein